MQAIKMDAEELRQFVRTMVRRHLRNVPEIDFPLPVPAGAAGGWTMEMRGVYTHGFGPLIEIIIDEARLSVALKAAASGVTGARPVKAAGAGEIFRNAARD